MRNSFWILRSITSSRRITRVCLPPGIVTIRDRTLGTCTMANSVSPSPFFFFTSAPRFRDLLRISGKGLEESTAMGVSTG